MISISHMKKLSKSKPTEVWCLDSLGEHSIKFDRLSLCSQIKAIPIEDVIAMFTELQTEIEELKNEPACCQHFVRGVRRSSEVIQQKIDKLKENDEVN